jgi:iron complex outermembrane recepter protein
VDPPKGVGGGGNMRKRDICHWGRRASVVAPAVAVGLSIIPSSASAQTVLPDINVIAPTTVSGTRSTKPSTGTVAPANSAPPGAPAAGSVGPADLTSIDRDKVPSNTVVLTPNDFNHEYTPDFLDAMNRGLPGVSLSDQTGNPFQKDLDYRGYTASPVQGTPQGIAVYQNGVRVNESWGDIVNWDFIPEKLNLHTSYQLTPNVELFGLINNALNQHYYLFDTFTDPGGFTAANNNNPNTLGVLTDPRAFVPGMPFGAYAGLKATF